MDRTSGAEVGGPYASREDAQRAIERGGFDQDPAELVVTPDNGDNGDGTQVQAVRKHARVPQTPQGPNPSMGFDPHEVPQTPATKGPADPGVPPLPGPMPDGAVPTRTTKPAQTPGGPSPMGGPGSPAGPSEPEPGLDPIEAVRVCTAMVLRDNPGADLRTVGRIVGRVASYTDVPFLEDPLSERNPLKLSEDVIRGIVDTFQRIQPIRRRMNDWAERRHRERRPDRYFGEEESGQRTLFPEPPRRPQPPRPDPDPDPEPPQGPMSGQQTLFDDPDEVPDPPAPPGRRPGVRRARDRFPGRTTRPSRPT